MGDVIQFPAPAAPEANHTAVLWRGCWHCGLMLFTDEEDICTDCAAIIDRQPADPPDGDRPTWWYLRKLRPDDLAGMATAIIDAGVTTAETTAQQWAADHLDDVKEQHEYVGDVRGRCQRELAALCHRDGQKLGGLLGWS